jgi:hypothetical protein
MRSRFVVIVPMDVDGSAAVKVRVTMARQHDNAAAHRGIERIVLRLTFMVVAMTVPVFVVAVMVLVLGEAGAIGMRVVAVTDYHVQVETIRENGAVQLFAFTKRGAFWESLDEIPEPHGFDVAVIVGHGDHTHSYRTSFAEHEHHHGDPRTRGRS